MLNKFAKSLQDLMSSFDEEVLTYSSLVRFLNKKDEQAAISFMKIFKQIFDEQIASQDYDYDLNELEQGILSKAMSKFDETLKSEAFQINKLVKIANTSIEMGDPNIAGKRLAEIIKFMLKRIKPESRPKIYEKMREKILLLNPDEISNKKTPATSAMGQSLTFLKTVLIGNEPYYIRQILINIAKNM
jgi:hypothetical protein